MRFSLIIPTFNEEKTILEVIQKSKPYVDEIIIADDISTDNTVKIVEKAGVKVVLNTGRSGQEFNIANAIPYATGDIILTMDADLYPDGRVRCRQLHH